MSIKSRILTLKSGYLPQLYRKHWLFGGRWVAVAYPSTGFHEEPNPYKQMRWVSKEKVPAESALKVYLDYLEDLKTLGEN